jgi:hypothetical protein
MKSRLVGADFFQAHRVTDMTKVVVAFRKFTDACKNPSYKNTTNMGTRINQHLTTD